jgi:hypothetical protein
MEKKERGRGSEKGTEGNLGWTPDGTERERQTDGQAGEREPARESEKPRPQKVLLLFRRRCPLSSLAAAGPYLTPR